MMFLSVCPRRLRRDAARLAAAAATLALLAGCGGSSGGGNSPASTGGVQAHAYSVQFQEFAVPVSSNVPADPHPGSWPDDLAVDDQGSIWFGEHHADQIGRLVPAGAGYVYHGYPVPTPRGEMDCLVLDQTRRRVWVSENAGNKLVLLDTSAASPQAVEIPVTTGAKANPVPGDLGIDAAGNPWFTSPYDGDNGTANALGMLDAVTGQVSYFPTPTANGGMDAIAFDKTGAIWFVELGADRIGRYAGGHFTEFPLPRPGVVPTNLAVDGAGRVWVTEQTANAVAVFNPADTTGQPWHEVPVPTAGSGPVGITVDQAGNVWFTEITAGKIGLVPTGTLTAVDFAIPTPDSAPEDIQIAPDGRIFFTERYGNKIGQITLSP